MKNGLMNKIITNMKSYIKYICLFLLMIVGINETAWGSGIYIEYNNTKYYDGDMITIDMLYEGEDLSGNTPMKYANDAGWTYNTNTYGAITTQITGDYTTFVAFLIGSVSSTIGNASGACPAGNTCLYFSIYNSSTTYGKTEFSLGYYLDNSVTNWDSQIEIVQYAGNTSTVCQSATITVRYHIVTSSHTITYSKANASCAQNGSGSWPSNVSDITDGAAYNSLPTDIELDGVDGYTFVGWTSNSSFSDGSSAPSPLYTNSIQSVTNDITLYPVFRHGGSTGTSTTFSRITSTNVTAGYYIISNGQNGENVVGGTLSNDKLSNINISGGTSSSISATDRLAMWEIAASGDYWTIKNRHTGLYMALNHSGSTINGNKLAMQAEVDNYAKWTISQFNDNYHVLSAVDNSYYLRLNNGVWDAHTGGSEWPKYLYKYASDPGAATVTYTINPPCSSYTLTYNGNNATSGSVPAAATEYASGSVVTVLGNSGDLALAGHDFNGWKADNATSGTAYAAGSSITMNTNHTLYAQWEPHTISLTLDANTANGGAENGNGSATVKYGAGALESAGRTHATGQTGKTLEGYYAAADGNKKVLNNDWSFVTPTVADYISSSKWIMDVTPSTLYAHWRANTYTVVFHINDGGGGASGTMSNQAFTYGTAQNLTSNGFTWSSHNFEGWATTDDGNVVYGNGAEVNNLTETDGGTVNLYAVWTDKTYNNYTFTCSELTLDNEELSKVVWMTTYAGEVVRSASPVFKISGTGLKPGAAITFTLGGSSANSTSDVICFRTASYGSISANASTGELTETEVYAFYNPTATTDGLDQYASGTEIVATAAGGTYSSRPYMELTATLANVAINGRHLPSQFVIAAKWAGTWYALPADFTKTTSDTDCNGVPVAISVDADGSGNPTQAYGPSTLAYTVNMVGNGGTGTSTFRDNSKYLYLDMINNNHYALEAAGSGTSVARGSGNAATGDLSANYMWLLDQQTAAASTAAETEYHLCNAANTSNSLKLYSTANRWGLYSAGTTVATPAIRIIPLSVIEPLELSVLEWGETSLAVKSEAVNLSSGYTVTARLGSAAAAAVSSVSKIGDDLYIIRGVGSLLTGSGIGVRSLTITATPAEGTAKQAVIPVPLIISNDAAEDVDDYVTYTETQISSFAAGGTGVNKITDGRNIVKTVDVVVRKGGMLTNTSGASGDFADLHIYSGGKVDITNTIKFKNVYLRGGFSWLDNRFDELPRLKTAGANITLGTDGKVYYDLCLNSDIYYMMALPVDVPLSSVTNEEGTGTFKAWIKKYNGGARAGENSDPKWISVTSGSLQRGVGYEVAIKKRNNRPYGILRFPLLSSWSAESDFTPTVKAWGIDGNDGLKDGVTANNAGWNIVGNPFFTAFHNTNDFGSKVINYGFKPHGDPWDGTYEWDPEDASVIKFFSVPYRSFDDWHDERAIDAVLEPFFPFGVQVKSTGVLTFKAVNRDLKPSIYRKGIQEREVDVDFLLKDANGKTDNAGLTIGNTYSELFDSEDMEKTITNGTQYMKVYTMVGEYRTAFNYLPEVAAAQPIPVGYIAPVAGEYTFTLKPSGNYSQVEKVLLTDYQTSQTVDLLTEDYTFETEAGEINTRFALNVKLKAETATDMSSVEGGGIMNISVYGGDQHLVVRGLPTGADVWIYDAAGKLVASWNNVREASLRTDVPAAGVYSVRAVLGSEGVTRRAVVR